MFGSGVVRQLVHLVGFQVDQASLSKADAAAERLARSWRSRMHTMGTALAGAFSGAGIIAAGKHVFEIGNMFEQLEITLRGFETYGGQARKVMDSIVKTTTELPTVQMSEIAESIGTLVARGQDLETLPEVFRNMQIVIGATGGNFQRLANAFAETVGLGKLQKREVQLYIRGGKVPILDMLQEMYGEDYAKITSRIAKGQISAADVVNAFADATKEGGKYYAILLGKQKSLWGQWKVFADMLDVYLGRGEKSIYKKMLVPLSKLLAMGGKVLEFVSKLDGNFSRFFVITGGVTVLTSAVLALGAAIAFIGAGPIAVVTGIISALSIAIDDLYVWVKGGDSVMGMIFGDFEQYRPYLKLIKDGFILIFKELLLLAKELASVLKDLFFRVFGPDATDKMASALKTILGFFIGMLVVIRSLIKLAGEYAQKLDSVLRKNPVPSSGGTPSPAPSPGGEKQGLFGRLFFPEKRADGGDPFRKLNAAWNRSLTNDERALLGSSPAQGKSGPTTVSVQNNITVSGTNLSDPDSTARKVKDMIDKRESEFTNMLMNGTINPAVLIRAGAN